MISRKLVKAVKELIHKYETITPEKIASVNEKYSYDEHVKDKTKRELTGFGIYGSCILCIAVGNRGDGFSSCEKCVYPSINSWMPCRSGKYAKTYDAIDYAMDYTDLALAYRNRAIVLREALEIYLKKKGR